MVRQINVSGVARVPCALGKSTFCASINKTAESEMKNNLVANANEEHLPILHLFFSY